MVFKAIILTGGLALLSMGPAVAQGYPTDQPPVASTTQTKLAALGACEAQWRRFAGLNKTIAANYNAAHVEDVCEASTDGQSTW
jgi:hypothetical protein